MESTSQRLAVLSRTMDGISQLEVEEMADGIGPRPLADQQLHLNILRRRIQQQRSLVSKLSRDDLEDQYLHLLEEQELLKKEGNVKDDYIKKLSTKILRLQRSESGTRSGNGGLSNALRLQLEQKIRSLENQLRVAKVYGGSLSVVRHGSKNELTPSTSQADMRSQSRIDALKQQLTNVEENRKKEVEEYNKTVTDLQSEIATLTEKISTESARNTMLESMEITRLTRQLAKTSQELINLKNDFLETKAKLDEMQINKVVLSRDNERLKHEVDRHLQTVESMEIQLREAREKSLQQTHDKERANRLETELEWYKRQQQSIRVDQPVDHAVRFADNVLRNQVRTLEDELQREIRDNKEVRRRITEREIDVEKALRDVSDLRSANLQLQQECDDLKARLDGMSSQSQPKESDGWFRAPPGYGRTDLEYAFKLFDAFNSRRSMSTFTDPTETEKLAAYKVPPKLESQIEQMKWETNRISKELSEAKKELQRAEQLAVQTTEQQLNSNAEYKNGDHRHIEELQQKLDEKTRQLSQKNKIIENLERHVREFAEGTVVYDLEEEVVDQSRLSADNVNLQYGDNLLELHFGPFAFSEAFFEQAKRLRISKWRLTWSVFGENMFSQDSEDSEPDFDFTAIHCITMDEQIISDLSEGLVKVEITGHHMETAYAFAFASFTCQKLLQKSSKRLNRIRGEVTLGNNFGNSSDFGSMAYWFRIKFDIQQTQSLYMARRKAINYLTKDTGNSTTANQLWLETNGPNANVLHLRMERCRDVRALHEPGLPDCCILYQFYNSKTTYTPTIRSNENPDFKSEAVFRVSMNEDLENYLLSEKLEIYVTDARDRNQRHFLGASRLTLSELLVHPIMDRQVKLITDDGQQNGYLICSAFWERPYRTRGRPAQDTPRRNALYSARKRRASLTPRGSLVGISHSARLRSTESVTSRDGDLGKKDETRPPTREAQSGNILENNSHPPKPPPRRSNSSARNILRSDASDRLLASQKGNDYFSPPSTSVKQTIERNDNGDHQNDKNEHHLVSEDARDKTVFNSLVKKVSTDRVADHDHGTTEMHKSHLTEQYKRSIDSLIPNRGNSEKELKRKISDSVVAELKSSKTDDVLRRFTVGHPLPKAVNSQIIHAELHHNSGDRQTSSSVNKSREIVPTTRENSRSRQPSEGSVGIPSLTLPKDTIAVIIHSLYFVEGAPILAESLPGEIFVIFDFLNEEHESPLAVVKPSEPNKKLVFEFRKVFPMDLTSHASNRKLVEDLLDASPSGRIHFSVYFQPDDENQDCELVGVAALSLNRLLVKNQDAFDAELKLMSPSEKGQTVGYILVTVQAVDVLLDIKRQHSRTDG